MDKISRNPAAQKTSGVQWFQKNSRMLVWLIYLPALLLVTVSVGVELATGDSLLCLLLRNVQRPPLPMLFRANVVAKVIGLLGYGTVLIAFVFHSFDSLMLGIRYQELTDALTQGWFVRTSVFHVLAVVVCIATAAADMAEAAWLSLLCVMLGFGYQWTVLYSVIWSPKTCEALARSYINGRLDSPDCFPMLCRVARTLPESTNLHYQTHLSCLTEALCRFAEKEKSSTLQLTELWALLLSQESVWKNDMRALAIFKELCGLPNVRESAVRKLCCGYMAGKYEWWVRNQAQQSNDLTIFDDLKLQIHDMVAWLAQQCTGSTQEIICKSLPLLMFALVFYECGLNKDDKLSFVCNICLANFKGYSVESQKTFRLIYDAFPECLTEKNRELSGEEQNMLNELLKQVYIMKECSVADCINRSIPSLLNIKETGDELWSGRMLSF